MTEPTEASVRAEARAWLEANWSPDHGLVEWRNKLIDSGWGVPSWPKDWFGRELPMALEMVVEEELRRIGAVGVAKTGIRRLAAATLLVHGNDAQKRQVAAPQPDRRGYLVPVVLRAGLRLRSGGCDDARRVQGQPLGDQRPEGVDDAARIMPTGGCCWRAPTGTSRSIRGCRISFSISTSRASRCGRCGR